MWGYVALSELDRRPAETQLALATAIGYDKTRLVSLLDDLEADRLLTRESDPADRRGHVVRLTPLGTRRLRSARAAIRAMEDSFLGELTADERAAFLTTLDRLSGSTTRDPDPG